MVSEIKAHLIAAKFVELVRKEVGDETAREIDIRNTYRRLEGDKTSCASHDFCDSNVSMAAAFETILRHEPDCSSQDDADIMNAVWEIALKHGFEMKT